MHFILNLKISFRKYDQTDSYLKKKKSIKVIFISSLKTVFYFTLFLKFIFTYFLFYFTLKNYF